MVRKRVFVCVCVREREREKGGNDILDVSCESNGFFSVHLQKKMCLNHFLWVM